MTCAVWQPAQIPVAGALWPASGVWRDKAVVRGKVTKHFIQDSVNGPLWQVKYDDGTNSLCATRPSLHCANAFHSLEMKRHSTISIWNNNTTTVTGETKTHRESEKPSEFQFDSLPDCPSNACMAMRCSSVFPFSSIFLLLLFILNCDYL
eukprot:SAG31_NODE_4477_length_3200_cov_37.268946_3_plen_150_part_00